MEDIIDIIVTETTNLIEITSQPTDEIIDVNIIDNREDITLNVTPSVVEININSLTGNFGVNWGDIEGTLSNQTDLQNVLNAKADLVDGKVPSSQLPSYVDDVVEVANYTSLPVTGEVGKIYITLDTNFIYRWTGSTYVEIKDSSAVWGAITGTLSSQTDLQNALNAKEPNITSGTTLQYWRGDKSWQILNTTNVPEGTNLYFTDSRARAALSAGTGISYNSGTGIITNTITQYTDALARNAVSLTTTGSNGSATYNSTTGVLNVPSYTLSGLGGQPLATNLTALAGLSYSSLGFIKMTGVGTLALDTNTYALDSAVVKLTGTQSISGVKTFNSQPVFGNTAMFQNTASGTVLFGGYTTIWTTDSAFTTLVGTASSTTIGFSLLYDSSGQRTYTMPTSNGTLALTSQLSAYLPLTGGTLTGALSGTSATFSGAITGNGNIDINNTSPTYVMTKTGTGANQWYTYSPNGNYIVRDVTNSINAFTLTKATGAATFSSSVTAGNNLSGTNTNIKTQDSAGYGVGLGYVSGSYGYLTTQAASSPLALSIDGNPKLWVSISGNVGIGTTSPSAKLSISSDQGSNNQLINIIGTQSGYSQEWGFGFPTSSRDLRLYDYTLGQTRVIFQKGGNIIHYAYNVGEGILMNYSGGATYGFYNNNAGALTLTNSGVANVGSFNMSTGIYTPTSDINKKKDFEESRIGLNEILQLKPTLYRMKTDETKGIKELGFIAQEVKEIIPNAYVQNDDFIGLNFNPIVAALTKAVQELNDKVKTLENKQ